VGKAELAHGTHARAEITDKPEAPSGGSAISGLILRLGLGLGLFGGAADADFFGDQLAFFLDG